VEERVEKISKWKRKHVKGKKNGKDLEETIKACQGKNAVKCLVTGP